MKFSNPQTLLTVICFLIAGSGTLLAQGQRFRVVDDESGEPIFGATITSKKIPKGCLTDADGWCHITVAEGGTDTLTVSAAGYISRTIPVFISQKEILIALRQKVYELQPVSVTADRDNPSPEIFGAVRYDRAMLAASSLAGGESDPFAAVASEPGLTPMSDFSAGLRVRGLGFMHNQILFDGVELYHPYHLVGFISTFPGPVIDELVLYRDGTPPSYGGKLSSVIDIRTVTPDTAAIHGTFNLSLINASASVNIPLGNSVASLISIRSLYLDPVVRSVSDNAIEYSFNDAFLKTIWNPAPGKTLSFSAFYSKDYCRINEGFLKGTMWREGWSTWMRSIKYQQLDPNGIETRISMGLSEFAVDKYLSLDGNYKLNSTLRDYNARVEVAIPLNRLRIHTGLDALLYETRNSFDDAVHLYDIERFPPDVPLYAILTSGYIESTVDVALLGSFTGGLRFVHFDKGHYIFAEPRIAFQSTLFENALVHLGYQQIHQFTHVVPETGLPFPLVERFHSSESIPPAKIESSTAGVSIGDLFVRNLTAEMNIYYRSSTNLYEMNGYYTDNAYRIRISNASGSAYGLETALRGAWNRVTASINCSIGRSLMQSPEIESGNSYPSRHEVRGELFASISMRPWDSWQFDLSWTYMTGSPMTIPIGHIFNADIYSHRNEYYLPSQHWLDLKATYFTSLFRLKTSFYLHIHNAYNKDNPYYSYAAEELNGRIFSDEYTFTKTSILPIIPSVGFSMAY